MNTNATKSIHHSRIGALGTRILLVLTASAFLAACQNMDQRQQDTAKGAGIGAAVGAVAGAVIGGKKGALIGAGVGAAGGGVAGNIWSKKMEEKRRAMEQQTQGTGVAVTRTEDNQLKLNVPSDISFDTGKAVIKPELRSVLDSFANGLAGDPTLHVSIIGHTDSTGSDAINQPLSVERAQSVRDYLVGRGINVARIDTAGRGANEPVADNSTAEGRAKNRRVEIFLREPAQAAAPANAPPPKS